MVKISRAEKKLIGAIIIISLGFLSQILDFVPKNFWIRLFTQA